MARTGPICINSTNVALGLAQIRVGQSAPNIANTSPVLTAADSMGAMASTQLTGQTDIFNFESGFPLGTCAVIPLRETNMIECAFQEITPKNLALSRGLNPFAAIDAAVSEVASHTAAGTTTGNITVDNAGGVINDTWTVVFTDATHYQVIGNQTGDVGDGTVSADFAPDNGGNPYFTIPSGFFSGTWADDESYIFTTTEYVAGTTAYANAHVGTIGLGNVAAPLDIRAEFVYTFPDGVHTMTVVFPRAQAASSLALDLKTEDAAAISLQLKAMDASSAVSSGHVNWDSMPQGVIVFANS